MPRYKIRWIPFALKSLQEIHSYISFEAKSETPADKFILKLIYRTDALEIHPYIGQAEPMLEAIGQASRYLVESNYKIIYQVEESEVIITDVFHTKQNPIKLTKRGKKK